MEVQMTCRAFKLQQPAIHLVEDKDSIYILLWEFGEFSWSIWSIWWVRTFDESVLPTASLPLLRAGLAPNVLGIPNPNPLYFPSHSCRHAKDSWVMVHAFGFSSFYF